MTKHHRKSPSIIPFKRTSLKSLMFGFSILGLSSCATVKSTSPAFTSHDIAGMTYFLPKRLVKVTVTPVKKELKDLLATKKRLEAEITLTREGIDTIQKQLLASIEAQTKGASITGVKSREESKQIKLTKAFNEAMKKLNDLTQQNKVNSRNIEAKKEQPGACAYTVTASPTDLLPDPEHRYVADLSHSAFRDDTAKFKVTKNGLLTSANVVAENRVDDILISAAGAISNIISLTDFPSEDTNPAPPAPTGPCNDLRVEQYLLDPVSTMNGSTTIYNNNIAITFKVTGTSKKPTTNSKFSNNGLYYRTPVPVEMSIKTNYNSNWKTVSLSLIDVPQAGPVSYIPMNSAAFVKTVSDVSFENGILTGWNSDKPSEALELVRLPTNILKSVFSAPAELLSLKIDYSSVQESYAAQQLLLSQQQLRAAAITACTNAATSAENALICFEE